MKGFRVIQQTLFNPRQQKWSEHFIWTEDGLKIIGITPIGRATCNRLDFNDEYHNEGFIITPIFVVRLDERTGNVFILAGDNIEIEIYRNGRWRFL